MDKIDDLNLLHLFHQCSHHLYANRRSHGQERLLILLLENGTLTQRELIKITQRRSATLSEQLEAMDKAGYITRTRNEQDRRNIDVFLTSRGEAAAKDAQNNRIKRAHTLFSVLDTEDKKQLFYLLHKLLFSWENLLSESEESQK